MISNNIKALREAVGLSQKAFAERLGISSGVITNLEYGKLKNPEAKMPLLRLIAKEFGVPLDWILNGTGDPPLADPTEAEREAMEMGRLMDSDDPVVKAFLTFWGQRTKAEREALTKALYDFSRAIIDSQPDK